MTDTLSGSCLCGSVNYEISETPIAMGKCHCRDCQKATGSAYFPYILVDPDTLKTEGETKTYTIKGNSGQDVDRLFCPSCGTYMFGKPHVLGGLRTVSGATLDKPEDYKPDADIWIENLQAWDCLDPNTAKFDQNPEG